MSWFGAALWIAGATVGFLLLVGIIGSLRESASRDQISLTFCQVLAYLLALFGILRVYGPEEPIGEFVALRRTHPGFAALALPLGLASAVPATWLYVALERWWPPAKHAFDFVDLFFEAGRLERVGIAVAVVIAGPLVEELLFRGALFTPLGQRQRPSAVVLVTAALFALVHSEPRSMPPIFLLGLLLGYLRVASESLWPPLLLHAGFNAVPFLDLFTASGPPPPGAPEEPLSATLTLGATAICLGCLAGVWALARRRKRRGPWRER
jgi:membrane protease YdiL (CAAX protease family)